MTQSEEEHLDIKNRAAQRLLALPGVVAVGLGSKEVSDEPTGEPAIKVFVKVKRAPEELPADELIPAEIEGVPTDVIESGELYLDAAPPGAIVTVNEYDDTRYRPLTAGGQIRREESSHNGTIGCFLVDNSVPPKVYALTNFHVLNPKDVPAVLNTSKVGQPKGKDSVTHCCSDMIGVFAGGAKTTERDEAVIILDSGTEWLAEIVEIGIVTGKHAVTQTEANSQTYNVRKRGIRTRLTGGVVRALNATTHQADNVLVVKPNPNPAALPNQTVYFGHHGDSGSALVNDAGEVLGIHYSHFANGDGLAYAIFPVLSRLASVEHVNVDIAKATAAGQVNTVPGSPMVAMPPELTGGVPQSHAVPPPPPPGWVPDFVPLTAAPTHLQRDLDRSPTGRLVIALWLEHQGELLSLINTNRRVATAWHRTGTAALFQLLTRMTMQPDVALPATLNGRPIRSCLDRMHEIIDRFASPGLSRDLARLAAMVPDLAGRTYGQLIDSLGTG